MVNSRLHVRFCGRNIEKKHLSSSSHDLINAVVSNIPWTRSRCPRVFLRLYSAAEATFSVKQHQKSTKSLIFLVVISKAKFQWFHTFWCCFTKKVALAAEESLKNSFGHRERVQGVLLTPQPTWFDLKSFSLTYFPIESWEAPLRLLLSNFGL